MLLDNSHTFLDSFFAELNKVRIDVSKNYLDHIAYQANSSKDYDRLKSEILISATLKSEEIIGGRRVGIFLLNVPLRYHERIIPVIELIETKA